MKDYIPQTADPGFSWPFFVLQQIAVPSLSVLAMVVLSEALTAAPYKSGPIGDVLGAVAYSFPALCGFMMGLLARSKGLEIRESGQKIWIAPVALFVLLFGWEWFSFGSEAISAFFGVRGGATEEGIGAILVTLPTSACVMYSVGIGRRPKTGAENA